MKTNPDKKAYRCTHKRTISGNRCGDCHGIVTPTSRLEGSRMTDEQKSVALNLIAALASDPQEVGSLQDGDPLKAEAQALGNRITQLVGFLAIAFPNETINRLMGQVWHLFGSKTVATLLYPDVKTPSFAAVSNGKTVMPLVLFPPDWVGKVRTNPRNAMGALVFCGSQAVDAYNGKVVGQSEATRERARANEAEYLLTLRTFDPTWVPDTYQAAVLAEYPEGVKTPSIVGLWYEPKAPPDSPPPAFSA